ncbi:MAG: DnaJ domain-containing protein [Acidobacteriota bacterium]|nr:DnaJ domain-containing protein [Acidobacteriota bacterium]
MSVVTTQDRTLPRMLAEHAAAQSSGILEATRGKLKRLFCLDQGWLVFVASNLIEEQFDEYLVRSGSLQPSERAEIRLAVEREGKKLVDVLIEREILPPALIRRGMEGLITTLLSSSLEWPDGKFKFTRGKPDVLTEASPRLAPIHMVLRHARQYPASLDAVRVRISPPAFRPVASARADGLLSSMESTELMEYVLDRCDGSNDVPAIVAGSPADETDTLRLLYGYLMLGAVEEAGRVGATRVVKKTEKELTEAEVRAVLARANATDYYGVLGLERGAAPDQIRRGYYALARRYHPDHLRSGELRVYLEEMEKYFTRVTEAYNTLSDPALRREYDESLHGRRDDTSSEEQTAVLARQNFVRARELISKKRLTDAVRFLENAIELDPSNAVYPYTLGNLLSGNPRRRDDAETHLLRAKSLDPSHVETYVALGNVYAKTGRNGDAEQMYREALRWQPGHPDATEGLEKMGLG